MSSKGAQKVLAEKQNMAKTLKILKIFLVIWACFLFITLILGTVKKGCYFRYKSTNTNFQRYEQVILRADGNYSLSILKSDQSHNEENVGSKNSQNESISNNPEIDILAPENYEDTSSQNLINKSQIQKKDSKSNDSNIINKDISRYGEWLDTGVVINTSTEMEVEGKVMMCSPKITLVRNIGNFSAVKTFNELEKKYISIPNIGAGDYANDVSIALFVNKDEGKIFLKKADFIPIEYANLQNEMPEWTNIGEVRLNDEIEILLNAPSIQLEKSNNQNEYYQTQTTITTTNLGTITGDCTPGRSEYSPVCGIYTPFSGKYTTECWCDQKYIIEQNICSSNVNKEIAKKLGINPNDKGAIDALCINVDGFLSKILSYIEFWNWNKKQPESAFISRYTIDFDKSTTMDQEFKLVVDEYQHNYQSIFMNPQKTIMDLNSEYNKKIESIIENQYKLYPQSPLVCNHNCVQGNIRTVLSREDDNLKKFWLTSTYASGLIYRFSKSCKDTQDNNSIPFDFTNITFSGDKNFISSGTIKAYWTDDDNEQRCLQVKLYKPKPQAEGSGGYVIHPRINKCIAVNGRPITTQYGEIEYILSDNNPNEINSEQQNDFKIQTAHISTKSIENGSGNGIRYTLKIAEGEPEGVNGKKLWLRIKNDHNNYKESFGSYNVRIFESDTNIINETSSNFLTFTLAYEIAHVLQAGLDTFKAMTCYNVSEDTPCTDFFKYVRAMLVLYVMFFGFRFALGATNISSYEFVINLIKLLFVAGLINGSTFDLFQNYVMEIVSSFSNQIMSAISGYNFDVEAWLSNFRGAENIDIETKKKALLIISPADILLGYLRDIIMSDNIFWRFLSIISNGPVAVLYFTVMGLMFVSCIGVITRFVGVIIVCGTTMAILIGLAPIFITFVLFEQTRHLFENWINYMWRMMVEPFILGIGIYTLIHLFNIYLDKIMGHSVCWKCALLINLPITVLNLPPVVCINWLVQWGHSNFEDIVRFDIDTLFGMLIIKFCLDKYEGVSKEFCSKMSLGMGSISRMTTNAVNDLGGLTKSVINFLR